MEKLKKGLAVWIVALVVAVQLPGLALAAEQELIPMGGTVGIEMKLDGVMVIGLSDSEEGDCPAEEAGILPGDVILKIGDKETPTAEAFMEAVSELNSEPVEVTVRRNGEELSRTLEPVVDAEGAATIGVWLRDGVSGTGTLTFYDPRTGCFGALGHGITDVDTGTLFPLEEGEITDSKIVEVKKGQAGAPGELCGSSTGKQLGEILQNTEAGIFGVMDETCNGDLLPVADPEEVELGPATILSNVQGDEICSYDVEIVRVYNEEGNNRSMMIKVTDPELLECTGGIVQGMSGSPILQNGKLVGAVTHVLVGDPTKGYGIFIENMLEAAA
jgi:stage IV sporulation protein B